MGVALETTPLMVHWLVAQVMILPNLPKKELQPKKYNTKGWGITTPPLCRKRNFGLTLWGFRDRDSWLYDGGSDWPLLYGNDFNTKISHRGLVAGLNGENPE